MAECVRAVWSEKRGFGSQAAWALPLTSYVILGQDF